MYLCVNFAAMHAGVTWRRTVSWWNTCMEMNNCLTPGIQTSKLRLHA